MLDDYTRAQVNRAIEDALRPRGMSVHSGKVSIDAGTLQRLIVMIDRGAEALLDAQERIAELELDAARWRFYRDHGGDMIEGQTLHAWIESNKLRFGGRQSAIDAAIRKEGDDAPAR